MELTHLGLQDSGYPFLPAIGDQSAFDFGENKGREEKREIPCGYILKQLVGAEKREFRYARCDFTQQRLCIAQ